MPGLCVAGFLAPLASYPGTSLPGACSLPTQLLTPQVLGLLFLLRFLKIALLHPCDCRRVPSVLRGVLVPRLLRPLPSVNDAGLLCVSQGSCCTRTCHGFPNAGSVLERGAAFPARPLAGQLHPDHQSSSPCGLKSRRHSRMYSFARSFRNKILPTGMLAQQKHLAILAAGRFWIAAASPLGSRPAAFSPHPPSASLASPFVQISCLCRHTCHRRRHPGQRPRRK